MEFLLSQLKYMELIEKIVSDENGHAKTSRLEVGKYYIKEVKTNNKTSSKATTHKK